jgi:4-hydroxybenzoate polyprenyltransferase
VSAIPSSHPASNRFWRKLELTLEMIKFEHSIFALPFALTGALEALRASRLGWAYGAWKLAWIVVAMVGARSAAMTFNRIVDAAIDARNPRTKLRQLPAGTLSARFAWGFFLAAVAVFLFASALLGPLCLQLAPLALGVVLLYSYTKRFTSWCHVVLGLALGIAPAAAWIAVAGSLNWKVAWLTGAVMLWTAGFDIIYACQDYEFDAREGLFSLPRRFRIGGALWISRLFHVGMIVCLWQFHLAFSQSVFTLAALAAVAALLAYEHSLVRANDLSRVDAAFFTVNGWIGVLFLVFWALGQLLGHAATRN